MKKSNGKPIGVALALAFCFAFAGCSLPSGGEEADVPPPSTEQPETPETPENPENPETPEEGETFRNEGFESYLSAGYSALFADPYLKNGVSLVDSAGNGCGDLVFTGSYGAPSWTFAQWFTKYDLSDYSSRSYSKGGAAFRYVSKGETKNGEYVPAKTLAIDSTTATIFMELNAEVEYDAPRKSGEGWPHTLFSQDFSGNLIHVCELSELVMDMDYTVTKCEDKMNGAADPDLHCAQFVWYITLQNRTPGSAGYGQYIWFGLNLWDNRMEGKTGAEYAQQDVGKEDSTLAFIYQPSSDRFLETGKIPAVGERTEVNFSLLDTARYAYNLARERGYLADTAWEDIYVGGMNFGFEITGTYNAAVEIETVGVYYK